MLEPRETDVPALFLFFVVLPLVAYFLLGRWSEVSKKKERLSLLTHCAGDEVFTTEPLSAATLIPLVQLPKINVHECARCYAPATTRCSRCKSVRYCSGKCQIIHWRQVHKHECHQMEQNSSSSSPKAVMNEKLPQDRILLDGNKDSQCFGDELRQSRQENILDHHGYHPNSTISSEAATCMGKGTSKPYSIKRRSVDKQVSRKFKGGILLSEDRAISESSEDACRHKATSKEGRQENIFESKNGSGISILEDKTKTATSSSNLGPELIVEGRPANVQSDSSGDKEIPLDCLSETSGSSNTKANSAPHLPGSKQHRSPKSVVKPVTEHSCPDTGRKGQFADESKVGRLKDDNPEQGHNGNSSMGLRKIMGLMRSPKFDRAVATNDKQKKIKMLFPYDEFVKFFHSDFSNLSPRGFINCGNSCYANAVLQCLTFTKPLTIFLLRRSHSRHCRAKDWCLMCELEKHATMLTESGGPVSPSRLLTNMRNINCQIGDGSQEDAHEFLRFLVTSMQSIGLEGLDGENVVDTRLQETTFIHHTFGGCLRSKVKCLRCHNESERYESIMDLTLEIFGWVESLEDALTQFTSAEDLDGENMYRCGRCAAYVRARKQLSIQEAPNILTIVLKRFQEGNYGKINKRITFPDMLDMIPFMTGTDDIPPLYILYAVVVHLDTQSASFSGHYVAYVKNLQGIWFRIDDTEVQPVHMSQVMSEEAYILFYMRSCPRPAKTYTGKPIRQQAQGLSKHWSSKTQTLSGKEETRFSGKSLNAYHSSDHKPATSMCSTKGIVNSLNGDNLPFDGIHGKSRKIEFLDANSSDWSIFTSSDDASFTTESTRDSFSTVDYADGGNMDPVSSIFNTVYMSEYSSHRTVSCCSYDSSRSHKRYASVENGFVFDSSISNQSLEKSLHIGNDWRHVNAPSVRAPPYVYVGDEDNYEDATFQTSNHCKF
ncbi:ubiquitin carboxyl-terminal hydrolase 15 [Daucus carota subsp. sativus]|uniref:ubiquitin carboxyl-terminal hydrolase 15 n=1 Tax=Daucus carota subsp. sativus TaxID=79200 RepID=UPI0007F041E6|nr:PREDICTED: ubiquitin carboxyl-terminal hydrolase 15-like [Daucus carota subsp. sativus]